MKVFQRFYLQNIQRGLKLEVYYVLHIIPLYMYVGVHVSLLNGVESILCIFFKFRCISFV